MTQTSCEPIVKDSKISEEIDQNFTKSSDDGLEKAAEDYSKSLDYYHYTGDDPSIAFVAGANWQKERFEKERLAACDNMTEEEYKLETDLVEKHIKKHNCLPTFADAIKYGMEVQKEKDHNACLFCENSRDVVFHNGIKHAIEQMKKEAVEGTVCKQRASSQATWIELAPNSLPAFDDCELVKCIILKDENGDSCTWS